MGRHTITGLLRLQDRSQQDWSADYRFYSRDRFDEDKAFAQIRLAVEQRLEASQPLVAAMDDSLLRKSGHKIAGARYQRDPMSPPFCTNFVRGLRVLQISAAVARGSQGEARMIPVDFLHAALPAKPHKNAPAQEQEAYQEERTKRNINVVGRQRLAALREQMDQGGSSQRPLVVSIDGRFTNSTVLRQVPQRTHLIGRVRKDAVFYEAPKAQPERGRKRKYGQRCPTPQALLKDAAQPWQEVKAFAAGEVYTFKVKTLENVYTPMNKGAAAVRVVVIEPVPYRSTKKSKLQRRQPAFLICTDPQMSLEKIIQYYLWRWDIEVNFRDEKTLLGVGQAQVRTEASNQNAPALGVLAYAILLLGSVQCYGAEGKPDTFKKPRWQPNSAEQRPTTPQLINQLRYELWASALKPNFMPLSPSAPSTQTALKLDLSPASALFQTTA
jgi:DDE superfamily endonuclease